MRRKPINALLWFSAKKWRVFLVDLCCIALALLIGWTMRHSFSFVGPRAGDIWNMARAFAAFSFLVLGSLFIGGTYRIVWTRASIEEYALFARWYLVGSALFIALDYLTGIAEMPRSLFLILLLLGIMFMGGVRAFWRLAAVRHRRHGEATQRALIAGAGEAGAMIARDLTRNPASIEAVGFVDDNPLLLRKTIASLKVLGARNDLPTLIKKHGIDTVILAMPSASWLEIKAYVDLLNKENVATRILPKYSSLASGNVTVSRLRSVNLEDLLSREPVVLDDENISSVIKGKTVMVTGAGGSIGSEICRQALAREPASLLALGHGEQSIYLLLESLKEAGVEFPIVPIIADIADEGAMRMVFERHRPQVVFHAGAHKHVPLMEDNPREALRVNAFGTWNIARLAGIFGAERFVMISTDKAVHPSSIMGATKRAAERLLLSVQAECPETKYIAVRFGNVLGSRGSVIPKFERQIAAGGPVTVTHPEMRRYFMLIPEAVSLVLQSAAMGKGGELYVLDMGEPVKIADMAETLIRLHGYEPHKDIEIRYTGVRPGEKLYEELFYDTNSAEKTTHSKIFRARLNADYEDVLGNVLSVLKKAEEGALEGFELREAVLSLGKDEGALNGAKSSSKEYTSTGPGPAQCL